VLIRLGQITRGWSNYFKHAVCKHIFRKLAGLTWWRLIRWLMQMHRWTWKDVRHRFTTPTGAWQPITADGIEMFNIAAVPVTRYRYRGNTIPNPWHLPHHT
jgi:RNA-directed DNA polymerase